MRLLTIIVAVSCVAHALACACMRGATTTTMSNWSTRPLVCTPTPYDDEEDEFIEEDGFFDDIMEDEDEDEF